MKVLLAVDGSAPSQAALDELIGRPWPEGTEVLVVSVAHPWLQVTDPSDPFLLGTTAHVEALEEERRRAAAVVAAAAARIARESPSLRVEAATLEGSPKRELIAAAERMGADLILVGSHGRGPVDRFLLGSVSNALALHAPCSVEIVRSGAKSAKRAGSPPLIGEVAPEAARGEGSGGA